jgi:hypothetical protein
MMAHAKWAAESCKLVAWLREKRAQDSEEILSESFRVPGDAAAYVAVMREVAAAPEAAALAGYFRSSVEPGVVATELERLWSDDGLDSDDAALLGAIGLAIPEMVWTRLVTAIRTSLEDVVEQTPEAGDGVSLLLATERHAPAAREALDELAAGGYLLHWFAVIDHGEARLLAEIAFAVLRAAPNLQTQSEAGQSADGQQQMRALLGQPEEQQEVVGEFAKLVREHDGMAMVLKVSSDAPNAKPFAAAVIRDLLQQDEPFAIVTPALIAAKCYVLYEILGDDQYDELLSRAVREAGLRAHLMGAGFHTESCDLYQEALEVEGGPSQPEYSSFVLTGLRSLRSLDWLDALMNGSSELGLVAAAVDRMLSPSLGTYLDDGLNDYADQLLGGEPPDKDTLGRLPQVLASLDPRAREHAEQSLTRKLAGHSGPVSGFLKAFGSAVSRQAAVLAENRTHVVDVVLKRILDERNQDDVAWMADILGQSPELFHHADDDIRRRFGDRVRGALASSDLPEQVRAALTRICRRLDIELPSPDEELPEAAAPGDES